MWPLHYALLLLMGILWGLALAIAMVRPQAPTDWQAAAA